MDKYKNIYSNNDLTVTYEPCLCIHAERCAKELSEVFRLSIIPWIDLDATESKGAFRIQPSLRIHIYKNPRFD